MRSTFAQEIFDQSIEGCPYCSQVIRSQITVFTATPIHQQTGKATQGSSSSLTDSNLIVLVLQFFIYPDTMAQAINFY